MGKKITLGLALIVKDEAARVGGCLDSVKDLDELNVLDAGSTDDTERVVREHGGKLFKGYQWKDDYADARNESIKICRTNWVLVLGAGERVEPGSVAEIRRALAIVEKEHPEVDGCAILMKSTTSDDSFWYERVIRRNVRFKGLVHEYPVLKHRGQLYDVQINYTPRIRPSGSLIPFVAKMIDQEPEELRPLYLMAREHFVLGRSAETVYWLERYVRLRTSKGFQGGRAELADAYFTMAWALCQLKDFEYAKENCMRALMLNADFKEAQEMLAQIFASEIGKNHMAELNAGRWQFNSESSQNRLLNFKKKASPGGATIKEEAAA